jgi:hypothetical protein
VSEYGKRIEPPRGLGGREREDFTEPPWQGNLTGMDARNLRRSCPDILGGLLECERTAIPVALTPSVTNRIKRTRRKRREDDCNALEIARCGREKSADFPPLSSVMSYRPNISSSPVAK